MNNNIIAFKKDGTKVVIGNNRNGYKPIFYRFTGLPAGRRLDSTGMFNWLKRNSSGISLNKDDYLSPDQFEHLVTSPEMLSKPSQREIGLHPILRHYGGTKKTAYTFNEGVYSDINHIDWTFRPVGYFEDQ